MIYKGCERKMIMIKNPGNGYFDEAYFILKENREHNTCKGDMLSEANRIVNENTITFKRENVNKCSRWHKLSFPVGIILGATLSSLVFLIIK